ncbi:hypothetical protein K440DRAFT_660719 [Wilcoxina mikolae CBS 423.85]|nr:hypothetical protein K440DRAFT_660719 [Wilcoxina mikolae CBS 423.85]
MPPRLPLFAALLSALTRYAVTIPTTDPPTPTGIHPRATPAITSVPPLYSGICSEPIYHIETMPQGYFFAPWLGCDPVRPDCCPSDYPAYAFTVGTALPTGTPSDFRIASCPQGFTMGTQSRQPAGVSGVCCPPSFTPLESSGADWFQSGAMCARTMNQSELRASNSSTWRVIMTAVEFPTVAATSIQMPDRFSNRFVAVGFYMDPSATATGVTGATSAATSSGCAATTIQTTGKTTGGTGSSGVSGGAVAGVALGSVFVGAAVGAAVMWLLFMKRRQGGEQHAAGPGLVEMNGAESAKGLVAQTQYIEMDAGVRRRELEGDGRKYGIAGGNRE